MDKMLGTVVASLLVLAPAPAYAGDRWDDGDPAPDTRPCFSRSELDTVHESWKRARVERHTETVGAGVESAAARPDWTRVDYPACVTGQTVVVFYDEYGRWMSIGRG